MRLLAGRHEGATLLPLLCDLGEGQGKDLTPIMIRGRCSVYIHASFYFGAECCEPPPLPFLSAHLHAQHGSVYFQPGKGRFFTRHHSSCYFGVLGISFRAHGVDKSELQVGFEVFHRIPH